MRILAGFSVEDMRRLVGDATEPVLRPLVYDEPLQLGRRHRELAREEGIDLAASTAYSGSYSDVPFLEAVGRPVAANPDRKLRRIARERGREVVRLAA